MLTQLQGHLLTYMAQGVVTQMPAALRPLTSTPPIGKALLPAWRFISISCTELVCFTATGVSRYQAAWTVPSAPCPRNLPISRSL